MAEMVGNKNGISLWGLMSISDDPDEKQYVAKLNKLASAQGYVYFIDTQAEKDTKSNQVIWKLNWNQGQNRWEVSKFHAPDNSVEITNRMK